MAPQGGWGGEFYTICGVLGLGFRLQGLGFRAPQGGWGGEFCTICGV